MAWGILLASWQGLGALTEAGRGGGQEGTGAMLVGEGHRYACAQDKDGLCLWWHSWAQSGCWAGSSLQAPCDVHCPAHGQTLSPAAPASLIRPNCSRSPCPSGALGR